MRVGRPAEIVARAPSPATAFVAYR